MTKIVYQSRLDGLRFLAIILVLIEHFAHHIGKVFSAGFYGVNLFFVISGFLITSILLKEENNDAKRIYLNFLARRSLRIFPIYYLTILLLYLVSAPDIKERLPFLLTYTYNYHLIKIDSWSDIFVHFWSLCVEEQFYLFFPILAIFSRNSPNYFIITCAILCLLAIAQIFFNILTPEKYNYVSLLSNMWPLCMGAIGAILLKKKILLNRVLDSRFFELIVIVFIVLVLVFLPWKYKQLFLPVLSLYLVFKAYSSYFKFKLFDAFLVNKNVVYIGRMSYGIYIYHLIIGYYFTLYVFDPIWLQIPFEKMGFFSKIKFNSWILKLPLYSILSIFAAYLSFRYLETPFLKLKDKYFSY